MVRWQLSGIALMFEARDNSAFIHHSGAKIHLKRGNSAWRIPLIPSYGGESAKVFTGV